MSNRAAQMARYYQRNKQRIQARHKARCAASNPAIEIQEKDRAGVLARLFALTEADGAHWVWVGAMGGSGPTPIISCTGRVRGAARVSYAAHHNVTVSPSDRVSRTCDRRYCVSPMHLELQAGYYAVAESGRQKRKARLLVEAKIATAKFMEWRRWKDREVTV